jgi:hypothetical protein
MKRLVCVLAVFLLLCVNASAEFQSIELPYTTNDVSEVRILKKMGITFIEGPIPEFGLREYTATEEANKGKIIYKYTPTPRIYLCAQSYIEAAVETMDECWNKGDNYWRGILDTYEKNKYHIRLENYREGNSVEVHLVHLDGKKIGDFELNDVFNDSVTGCTDDGEYCIYLEGDEEGDFSIDIDRFYTVFDKNKAPAAPTAAPPVKTDDETTTPTIQADDEPTTPTAPAAPPAEPADTPTEPADTPTAPTVTDTIIQGLAAFDRWFIGLIGK